MSALVTPAGFLGSIQDDQTLEFKFNTHQATGAPITLGGVPVVSIYESGNDVQFTTGVTLTVDYDGVTGFHKVELVTTDAAYEAGKEYAVVITTGTVDTVSVVGMTVASFCIENRTISNAGTTTLGALTVTGTTAFIGDFAVLGDTDFGGAFNIAGRTTFDEVYFNSTVQILGALTATHASNDIRGVQMRIEKNTALSAFPFLMLNSLTGDPLPGLTVTAERSIDGGAFAACANAVSEISAGWYYINLAAADLNGNTIALKFTATGAEARNMSIVTQA